MQGGLLKSASAVAIIAAAGLFGASPAKAADLGGDCCADLEERVAELEATTVRKGTRKVSLTISGFVAHQVMWWNDGTQKDFYIGDGGQLGSRFRFVGTAKISPQMSAGFLYEMQANTSGIHSMNQLNGGQFLGSTGAAQSSTLGYAGCSGNNIVTTNPSATNSIGCPVIRDTTVWLRHNQLGMVKIGHGSTATDNLVLIDLGGAVAFTSTSADISLLNGGFILRSKSGQFAQSSSLNWANAIRGHESFDTFRRTHVLYETPALLGFVAQAAIANENFWDIALRYSGEFGGVRLAGGIGYSEDTGFNGLFQGLGTNNSLSNSAYQAGALCGNVAGPAASASSNIGIVGTPTVNGNCNVKAKTTYAAGSILHVDTGLFVSGSYGKRQLSGSQNPNDAINTAYAGPDLNMVYITGGLSKNYFGIGKTVISADWSSHSGGLAQAAFLTAASGFNACTAANVAAAAPCGSTVKVWGVQAQQTIDAAAMTVFVAYHNFSLDTNGFSQAASTATATTNGNLNKQAGGVADFQQVLVGTRIEF